MTDYLITKKKALKFFYVATQVEKDKYTLIEQSVH